MPEGFSEKEAFERNWVVVSSSFLNKIHSLFRYFLEV